MTKPSVSVILYNRQLAPGLRVEAEQPQLYLVVEGPCLGGGQPCRNVTGSERLWVKVSLGWTVWVGLPLGLNQSGQWTADSRKRTADRGHGHGHGQYSGHHDGPFSD